MTLPLCPDAFRLTRRQALLGLTAAFTLGRSSMALAAPETDRRLVIVLMRGAMDGLSTVQPYGDADFAGLRGPLALPQPGQPRGVLDAAAATSRRRTAWNPAPTSG